MKIRTALLLGLLSLMPIKAAAETKTSLGYNRTNYKLKNADNTKTNSFGIKLEHSERDLALEAYADLSKLNTNSENSNFYNIGGNLAIPIEALTLSIGYNFNTKDPVTKALTNENKEAQNIGIALGYNLINNIYFLGKLSAEKAGEKENFHAYLGGGIYKLLQDGLRLGAGLGLDRLSLPEKSMIRYMDFIAAISLAPSTTIDLSATLGDRLGLRGNLRQNFNTLYFSLEGSVSEDSTGIERRSSVNLGLNL